MSRPFDMRVKIERVVPIWLSEGGTRRELKTYIEQALREAADEWIRNYLPLHFDNSAIGRYGYKPRSSKYNALKVRRNFLFDYRNKIVRPVQKPQPTVFSLFGDLKNFVMGNQASGDMLRRTRIQGATTRMTAKIPVNFPHPINAKNKGEMTRIRRNEHNAIMRLAFERLKELLRSAPRVSDRVLNALGG